MGLEKVGIVFNEYCESNKILKVLLPLSMPILLGAAGLNVFDSVVSIGSVAGVIVYAGFFLGVLLTFAKSEYRIMALGIALRCADYIINIIRYIVKYQRLSWVNLMYLLIWGFFAYMAYKKSIKMGL